MDTKKTHAVGGKEHLVWGAEKALGPAEVCLASGGAPAHRAVLAIRHAPAAVLAQPDIAPGWIRSSLSDLDEALGGASKSGGILVDQVVLDLLDHVGGVSDEAARLGRFLGWLTWRGRLGAS